MGKISHQRELRVWQKAMDSAMRIFHATKSFPVEERYSMTDQMRRSSRSVAANVAEAWCKRRYAAAFVAKLNDAVSEAAETQTWLEFALRCGYMNSDDVQELNDEYQHIIAQLVSMSREFRRWTFSGSDDDTPPSP